MDLILLTDELFKKLEQTQCLSILIFEAFLFRFLQ